MNPQSVPPEALPAGDASTSSADTSDTSANSFPPLPVRVLDEYDLLAAAPSRTAAILVSGHVFFHVRRRNLSLGAHRVWSADRPHAWRILGPGKNVQATGHKLARWPDLHELRDGRAPGSRDGPFSDDCALSYSRQLPDFYPSAADAHRHDGRRDRHGRVPSQPPANVRYRPGRPMGWLVADSAAGVYRHQNRPTGCAGAWRIDFRRSTAGEIADQMAAPRFARRRPGLDHSQPHLHGRLGRHVRDRPEHAAGKPARWRARHLFTVLCDVHSLSPACFCSQPSPLS